MEDNTAHPREVPVVDSLSVDVGPVRADLFVQLPPGIKLGEGHTEWVRRRLTAIAGYIAAVAK